MSRSNVEKWNQVFADGRALLYPDLTATHLVHRHVLTEPGMRRCLSIGCGNGNNEFMIARAGMHVTCTDASSAAIATCRRLADELGLADRIEAYVAPMDDLTRHADGSFDFVLHWGALHYERAEASHRSLAECHRVLRPGGILAGEVDSTRSSGVRRAACEIEPGTFVTGPGTVEWRENIEVHPYSQEELLQCLRPFAEHKLGYREEGYLGRLDVRVAQWFFWARK